MVRRIALADEAPITLHYEDALFGWSVNFFYLNTVAIRGLEIYITIMSVDLNGKDWLG